jgi:two-component system CheB/CheR fusion protein
VLFDVDSLKRSQEMVRQQTELLNQAHEPIIMWELDGFVIYWNGAAEDAYGYTRDEALGRRAHELLRPMPGREVFAAALQKHGTWTGDLAQTRRDGKQIVVESHMVIVQETDGRQLVVEIDSPLGKRRE